MSLPRMNSMLLLFATCCGCGPLASTTPVTYQITAASRQNNVTEARTSKAASPLRFVGRNSCSATACHGQPQAEPVSWRNAYPLWEAADPHRRAFDVLYTERSVQMFRKLTESTAATIDDAVYLRYVEERCIGCHATPPAGSLPGNKLVNQISPDAYWQGVSCESCHGPASHWLGQHYSLSWPETTNLQRAKLTAATGFRDTRSLEQRAETCLKCHHGPQKVGDRFYDVNHDLIAAGHPRLQFELHAYLANLPKHWNEDAEIGRYKKAKSQQPSPQSFHFDTWRAGQIQHAEQSKLLQQARSNLAASNVGGEWAEFANKDCRSCHHTFGDGTFRLTHTPQNPPLQANLLQQSTGTIAERASLVQRMLNNSQTSDQTIDVYLAAAAFAHDLPQGTLTSELTRLQHSLAQQSGASQYDLPGKFNLQQPELKQALISLQQSLQQLSP